MAILDLQAKFLETGEQECLAELYEQLVKLGKTILVAEKYNNDIDDVYDIASNVCIKLMDTHKPAIRSAVSAYIKNALFFKNKVSFHDSLEDHQELCTSDEEITSSVEEDEERSYEDLAQQCFDNSNVKDSGEVRLLVQYTLDNHMPFRQVRRWLVTKEDRQEYIKVMKEIRADVRKENM